MRKAPDAPDAEECASEEGHLGHIAGLDVVPVHRHHLLHVSREQQEGARLLDDGAEVEVGAVARPLAHLRAEAGMEGSWRVLASKKKSR